MEASKWKIKKGNIQDCRKAKETSSDTGMNNRAITVLHEQWICLGMQRHTHNITLVYNNLIPLSVASISNTHWCTLCTCPCICMYITCLVQSELSGSVSAFQLFMNTIMALLCIPVSELVSFALSTIIHLQ